MSGQAGVFGGDKGGRPIEKDRAAIDKAAGAARVTEVAAETSGGRRVVQVLLFDDDVAVRSSCSYIAADLGCEVIQAADVAAAQDLLKLHKIDLLLVDLRLPGGGGMKLIQQVKAVHPATIIVVMTAFATVASAVEAIRIGAGDYLTKPFVAEDLKSVIERATQRLELGEESRRLRERLRTSNGMGELVGQSPQMEKLYRMLSKVAFSNHPVLILGESGTGKDLVARSIHRHGPNAVKPFVIVDCGSQAAMVEGELFGHVKGAYPGAFLDSDGLLASAQDGTVYLDRIAELPLDLQAKLLRAIQDKEVHPVGGTRAIPFRARVLAAESRDLAMLVEQGQFRKDLYFRLNVVNLRLPALRDRRGDIRLLAVHFLERIERESGFPRKFSDEALRVMFEYSWPENVRELEAAIAGVCVRSTGPVLEMSEMATQLKDFQLHRVIDAKRLPDTDEGELDGILHGTLRGLARKSGIVTIATMEQDAILGTIRQLNGDKLMAAKLLGIGKTTLYRKLKEYGITDVAVSME